MSAGWTMPRDMSGFSDLEAAMLAAIHAAGLPEPVAEWPFDRCCGWAKSVHRGEVFPDNTRIDHDYRKGRNWRFDFAWPELAIAVECEGGTWSEGRHTRGDGFDRDTEKYNAASLAGWAVLRFTGERIASGAAIEVVEAALRQRMEAAR